MWSLSFRCVRAPAEIVTLPQGEPGTLLVQPLVSLLRVFGSSSGTGGYVL